MLGVMIDQRTSEKTWGGGERGEGRNNNFLRVNRDREWIRDQYANYSIKNTLPEEDLQQKHVVQVILLKSRTENLGMPDSSDQIPSTLEDLELR